MSPDAVHPNSGRERIVAARDGLGHFAAATAMLERDWLFVWRQNRDESPINFRAGTAGIASEEDYRVVRLFAIDEVRGGIFARLFLFASKYNIKGVVGGPA